MGKMSPHHEEERLAAQRAADWLRRLETNDEHEQRAFMTWIKESPRNVREVLLAATWDKVLDGVDKDKRFDINALVARANAVAPPFGQNSSLHLPSEQTSSRKAAGGYRWMLPLTAVAALLVAVAVWAPTRMLGHSYATAIGEQRIFHLDDGSTIHLNADSRVKEDFSRSARDIYLLEGQAIFKVAHDTGRPFRVHVDSMVIQAVGTQFDVNRVHGQTTVAVIEGKVKISTDDSEISRAIAPLLVAGEAAQIRAGGTLSLPAPINVAEATAWRQRRLVFRNQALADMALEFNRYNRTMQIHVEDGSLSTRRFNGVFDADDPAALADLLAHEPDVIVDKRASEIVIRRAAR